MVMTSLLDRPTPVEATAPRRRPLVLVATVGGASAALGPLVVLLAIGVIGWFISDAGAHGEPSDGMRMGALAWLAAHGSGLSVMGARVEMIPLGLTAISAWSIWRLGHRVGDALAGHGPDVHRLSDGERDLTVPSALAFFFVGYGAVAAVVLALVAGSAAAPSAPKAIFFSVALSAIFAGPAIATSSGRAAIWAASVPRGVRAALAVGRGILAALVAVALATFLAALAAGLGDAATMFSRLHTTPSEAGLFALLNLAFVPNAGIFAGSWLLGPGFAVGVGTLVTPASVVLGPLPLVPLLAALPDPGTPSAWLPWSILIPPLVAGIAAWRVLRRHFSGGVLRWDEALLAGCGGGIVAGIAFGGVASISGGAVGPGRMRDVGPFAGDVLVHAITACGFGGLVGAAVFVWWQRRAEAPD